MATSTNTHTPGPWHTGRNGDDCAKDHAICSGPHVIAKVYGGGYATRDGEGWAPRSAADARLIAAAPDLLDALRALLAFADTRIALAQLEARGPISFGTTADADIAQARALIARLEADA